MLPYSVYFSEDVSYALHPQFLLQFRNLPDISYQQEQPPAKVIEMERKKQADAESKIKSIEESIAALKK